jgi:uncharacterized protein YhhL (DUF1145 family)
LLFCSGAPGVPVCAKVISEPRRHVYTDFGGGDGLKFGDVITAVASLAVGFFLFDCLFNLALVPTTKTDWGAMVAVILSILVSGLVVGYVFAGKIQEDSRRASIGKVVILFAAVFGFLLLMVYGAIYHYGSLVDETLGNMYKNTSTWTNTEWFAYEIMALTLDTALFIVYALVFGFIGLYLGSMRKPSVKTKE